MSVYNQHPACFSGMHWPDTYSLGKGSFQILESKGFSYFDREKVIPYSEISSIEVQKSFLGWLLGYRTLVISGEAKSYTLKYIRLKMVSELKSKIDGAIEL